MKLNISGMVSLMTIITPQSNHSGRMFVVLYKSLDWYISPKIAIFT